MSKITAQQKSFGIEYLKDHNGKQAAIRAGYSPKSAEVQASRLLSNAKVQAYIQELSIIATKRNDITVDRVLQEIALIAFLDIKEFYNDNGTVKKVCEIEEKARRAISSVTTRELWIGKGEKAELFSIESIKSGDKLKALELLGRYLSMFKDKLEISVDEKIANWMKQK